MNRKTIRESINEIAEALEKLAESVRDIFGEFLPEVLKLMKRHKQKRWLPVRYIGVNGRRTDRRPQVHRIRNALPNMHKDRRMKRKGD